MDIIRNTVEKVYKSILDPVIEFSLPCKTPEEFMDKFKSNYDYLSDNLSIKGENIKLSFSFLLKDIRMEEKLSSDKYKFAISVDVMVNGEGLLEINNSFSVSLSTSPLVLQT